MSVWNVLTVCKLYNNELSVHASLQVVIYTPEQDPRDPLGESVGQLEVGMVASVLVDDRRPRHVQFESPAKQCVACTSQ